MLSHHRRLIYHQITSCVLSVWDKVCFVSSVHISFTTLMKWRLGHNDVPGSSVGHNYRVYISSARKRSKWCRTPSSSCISPPGGPLDNSTRGSAHSRWKIVRPLQLRSHEGRRLVIPWPLRLRHFRHKITTLKSDASDSLGVRPVRNLSSPFFSIILICVHGAYNGRLCSIVGKRESRVNS